MTGTIDKDFQSAMQELGELVGHYATLMGIHGAAAYEGGDDNWHMLISQLVKAQHDWAITLNGCDQGSRHPFDNFDEWANRLGHLKAARDKKLQADIAGKSGATAS